MQFNVMRVVFLILLCIYNFLKIHINELKRIFHFLIIRAELQFSIVQVINIPLYLQILCIIIISNKLIHWYKQ